MTAQAAERRDGLASILVMGESLIDHVTTTRGTTSHPGGSPANLAVGLARLEANVSLLTQLGDDDAGQLIRRHLQTEGVRLLASAPGPQPPTSSATALLNADGSAEYLFDISWSLPARDILEEFNIVHAGSISAFLLPGASAVQHLLQQHRNHALLSFDPNIRPQLLPNHHRALKQFEAFADLVDIIKLSDEDAKWLYPHRSDAFVLDDLHERGVGLAVLTQGQKGAMLSTPDLACHVPATTETVSDTIGAGDSYMAALLHWIASHGRLPTSLQELSDLGSTSAHASGITVSRAGAQPPTKAELHSYLETSAPAP